MDTTTIRLSDKMHRTLLREKLRLRAKNMDEVLAVWHKEARAFRVSVKAQNGRTEQEQVADKGAGEGRPR